MADLSVSFQCHFCWLYPNLWGIGFLIQHLGLEKVPSDALEMVVVVALAAMEEETLELVLVGVMSMYWRIVEDATVAMEGVEANLGAVNIRVGDAAAADQSEAAEMAVGMVVVEAL